jgi:hypothetical protein
MSIVYFLGKNPVINLLGSHSIIGVLVTVLAVVASLTWEYIRLEPSGRWLAHRLTVRRVAVTLAVISIFLIGSRFAAVWTYSNGY